MVEGEMFNRRLTAVTIILLALIYITAYAGNKKETAGVSSEEEVMAEETVPMDYEFVEEKSKAPVEAADVETMTEDVSQEAASANSRLYNALFESEPVLDGGALMEDPDQFLSDDGAMSENLTEEDVSVDEPGELPICKIKDMGIQFLCDLNQEVIMAEDGVERVVMQEDPIITMAFKKLDKKFLFLSQLNTYFFKQTGLYKDGFRLENVEFAGHDAVLVKALSAFSDNTQRRDYFYIYDGVTVQVSFLFSDEKWGMDERVKLKEIIEGFEEYIP